MWRCARETYLPGGVLLRHVRGPRPVGARGGAEVQPAAAEPRALEADVQREVRVVHVALQLHVACAAVRRRLAWRAPQC